MLTPHRLFKPSVIEKPSRAEDLRRQVLDKRNARLHPARRSPTSSARRSTKSRKLAEGKRSITIKFNESHVQKAVTRFKTSSSAEKSAEWLADGKDSDQDFIQQGEVSSLRARFPISVISGNYILLRLPRTVAKSKVILIHLFRTTD